METLSGKIGVVTGGASGIGKAIARAMVAQDMRVIIADLEVDRLHATAQEIGALPVVTDVSKAEQVTALARCERSIRA